MEQENIFESEELNVLYNIIKDRGYEFFEKTPKTSMTIYLVEDLHERGFEIKKKKSPELPEDAYYYLETGDYTQAGDEYYDYDDANDWVTLKEGEGNYKYNSETHYKMRRKL